VTAGSHGEFDTREVDRCHLCGERSASAAGVACWSCVAAWDARAEAEAEQESELLDRLWRETAP
jgi:hypothetical protein